MGKLIICNGKQTTNPYYLKITNTNVYSIEELCYYIYNFIEIINEDMFTESLIIWISEELELDNRANKLRELVKENAGLKDYIVCVLCSSDFYTEMEIKQLLHTLDELIKLAPMDKKIKKADNYLRYRQFTEAATEYENILNGKDSSTLTNIQKGNLLHNLGIVQLNTFGVTMATRTFKEAYDCNGDIESLKHYLYTLLLSKQDETLKQEVLKYGIKDELSEDLRQKIEQAYSDSEDANEYSYIKNLLEYRWSGKMSQFYGLAKNFISDIKKEYRQENS
jgi:hypothetical protein